MSFPGKLKPLRFYSELDVINWYSLNANTGLKGLLVSPQGSGWNLLQSTYQIFSNDAGLIGTNQASSPRYWITSQVGPTPSGQKPFGMMLYDVLLQDAWGHQFRYDPTRKTETESVVSGEAVPVVRRGHFLIQVGTGNQPLVSGSQNPSYLGTSDDGLGSFKILTSPTNAIGEFESNVDNDGYAMVYIDCYKV